MFLQISSLIFVIQKLRHYHRVVAISSYIIRTGALTKLQQGGVGSSPEKLLKKGLKDRQNLS
jgi:hypothetical protein